jgi:hypothetical protein
MNSNALVPALSTLIVIMNSHALCQHYLYCDYEEPCFMPALSILWLWRAMLYASIIHETWHTTKTNSHKLQFPSSTDASATSSTSGDFQPKPLGENWVSSRWARDQDKEMGMDQPYAVKSKQNITKQSLDWNPQGKRKVGRPRQTWWRSTDAETRVAGMSWAELKRAGVWEPSALEECGCGPMFHHQEGGYTRIMNSNASTPGLYKWAQKGQRDMV